MPSAWVVLHDYGSYDGYGDPAVVAPTEEIAQRWIKANQDKARRAKRGIPQYDLLEVDALTEIQANEETS